MADIDDVDEDHKLISEILEEKRKTDPQGLLRAKKEGLLVEYLAADLANARQKNKKGFARQNEKSLSRSPRSAVRDYTRLEIKENKENSSFSFSPKPAQVGSRLGGRKTRSSPAFLALLAKSCQPAHSQSTSSSPPLLATPYLPSTSPKINSGKPQDYKTSGVLNFLMKEKHNKPNTKRKDVKRVLDIPTEKTRHSAPELTKISATQTSRSIEKRINPLQRRSHEIFRPKKSHLTIVPEKPRSKSQEVDTVKPTTKLIEKQKSIRRNFYGKQNLGAYKPLIVRSKSYSPKYEMKQNYPLEKMRLGRAAMLESKDNSDVPKLLNIKRKTFELVKKAPGGIIFTTLKKNAGVPKKGIP